MLIFLRVIQFIILYGGCTYLFYAPFLTKLRFSPKKLLLLLTLLFSFVILCYVGLLTFVSGNAAHCWFLVTLPICGVFVIWTINESFYKSVLALLLVGCYGAFICGYAVFIANLMFDKGQSYEILYTVAYLCIGGATYIGIHDFMTKRIIPIISLANNNELKSVYFMPLFYIILQAVFFTFYDTMSQISDMVYFIVILAINVSTYFLVMDILHILNGSIDKMRMREEISTAEKLLDLQKSQYASWVEQIETIRRTRHDLKHHIAMIQAFIDNDDKAGLQEYVKDFNKGLPAVTPMFLCKNMDVNAILLHYYERAQNQNIKFELFADIDLDISINSHDLAVIFGNCLENAFEACERMNDSSKKSVSLMAKPMGHGLAIIIDNTFDGKTIKENDIYLSSKRNSQAGIGMESVKLVVQKYAGIVSFETDGNLFMTSIRLGGKAVVVGELNYEK